MTAARRFEVAFPLAGFNPSGGVRMLIHVANALAARGVAVAVSVPGRAASPPIPLHPGVTLLVRHSGGGLRPRLAFLTGLPRADVQVATGYQTPVLIRLGAIMQRAKPHLVYLIQGDEPTSHIRYGARPAWVKAVLRAVARSGYRVPATRIAVSRFVAQRVGEDRVHRVIAPGIEPAFLRPLERRPPGDALVQVGVLSHPAPAKGTDVALDAFARLRDDARLRFVVFDGAHATASPPFVERFSALVGARELARDIDAFFSLCDIFVFPSRVEGFGLPPLEAMARGAAVVVSDCGGVREYVEPERNCLLVPPGDAAAIAAAIRRLADPELRARLVRAGRETAERFPVATFARACADEIQRVLADATGRNPH
jgi:glycosyltransferase involved in cell wall biosynthesis